MLRKTVLCIMATLTLAGSVHAAERLFLLKIGPTWPQKLRFKEEPTAWDASVQTGIIVDRKIAFGGGVDFLWDNYNKPTPVQDDNYRIDKSRKAFMFPVSGYIALTPIPDFKFHPCGSVQIGLNTAYYSEKKDSTSISEKKDSTLIDENGWYMGFYLKVAADAIFNLGEQAGLFAGIEYQWANMKKLNTQRDDIFRKLDMSGVGIRMGFRVIY
jgi:hypothetical protein